MSSTFHPQWANHAEQSTLSPLAKHQLTMASRQRPSRLVWIPLYFIIYMSTCYSAGRKEQCPGDARLQHHHALQEQGRLQRLWYLPWNVPPQYHWKGFYPFRVEQIADASRTVVSWGTVWVQSWKVNNWHDFFHWGSFRKSVVSRGNTCILPLSRPDQGLWPSQQGLFTVLRRMGCHPSS